MDSNLDAKRLEELAEMANRWSIRQDKDGWGRVADDFRDLARCAKAWARVERELSVEGGQSVSFVRGFSGIFYTTRRVKSVHDTAIAAVEAAPEATDAK